MNKEKIAITIDKQILRELDRLVKGNAFQSRSQVIQDAVSEKLQRFRKTRLITESAKLNSVTEKELAEEGLALEVKEWPTY